MKSFLTVSIVITSKWFILRDMTFWSNKFALTSWKYFPASPFQYFVILREYTKFAKVKLFRHLGFLREHVQCQCSDRGSPYTSFQRYGMIQSPGYPDSYGAYENCDWTLNPPQNIRGSELILLNVQLETHVAEHADGSSCYGVEDYVMLGKGQYPLNKLFHNPLAVLGICAVNYRKQEFPNVFYKFSVRRVPCSGILLIRSRPGLSWSTPKSGCRVYPKCSR